MENQPLPKMYIAVRDDVPDHIVPTLVAHAVLAAHLQAQTLCEDFALYQAWLQHSFRKVVLRVNDKEFSKIKLLNVHLAHESTVLAGEKCAVRWFIRWRRCRMCLNLASCGNRKYLCDFRLLLLSAK